MGVGFLGGLATPTAVENQNAYAESFDNVKEIPMPDESDQRSWWRRVFGRSILSALIGHFFADKNNAASLIAIMLVATLCYIVALKEKYEYATGHLNIVFVVIGYYFGSKREKDTGDDEDSGK